MAAVFAPEGGSALGNFAVKPSPSRRRRSELELALALGRFISGGVLFVRLMRAIAQLKIDTGIVRIVTSIVLGGFALAFGISFGLGGREMIRNIAAGFCARKISEVGLPLEVLGQ